MLALAKQVLSSCQMSSGFGFFSAPDFQSWRDARPPASPARSLCCHPGTQKEMGQWVCQLKFQETSSSPMPADEKQLKIKGTDAFTFPWLNLACLPRASHYCINLRTEVEGKRLHVTRGSRLVSPAAKWPQGSL